MITAVQAFSQPYLDYQLRLEPVWSRVADALGEAGSVESAEFSPDGKFIISGTKYDNSVIMWRTSDGTELWRKYTAQEIERAGWSSDNQYVAACSEDFLVTVYEAKSGKVIREIRHTQGIDGLIWSNKGMLLVSGEEFVTDAEGNKSGWIRVFEMPEAKEITKINYGSTVNELFFTHDDRYLLAAGHAGIKIYNTSDWSLAQDIQMDPHKGFTSATFSPDGKYIIGASNTGKVRGNLYLWEWKSGKLLRSFNHLGKKVESVTWHPNGQYISFAGHDPYIYTYRVSDIIEYKNDRIPVASKVWAGDHAEYLDFNADGSFLVSAHQNGLIKLWAWMGEDPALNEKRHEKVKEIQKAYTEKENN